MRPRRRHSRVDAPTGLTPLFRLGKVMHASRGTSQARMVNNVAQAVLAAACGVEQGR